VRTAGVPFDGHMIKPKANHFVTRLKLRTFSVHNMPGESAAGSPDVMEDMKGVLQWYSSQNIYNADETGLYYKLLPERTLTVKDNI
jgi:hypothetical protein